MNDVGRGISAVGPIGSGQVAARPHVCATTGLRDHQLICQEFMHKVVEKEFEKKQTMHIAAHISVIPTQKIQKIKDLTAFWPCESCESCVPCPVATWQPKHPQTPKTPAHRLGQSRQRCPCTRTNPCRWLDLPCWSLFSQTTPRPEPNMPFTGRLPCLIHMWMTQMKAFQALKRWISWPKLARLWAQNHRRVTCVPNFSENSCIACCFGVNALTSVAQENSDFQTLRLWHLWWIEIVRCFKLWPALAALAALADWKFNLLSIPR